MIQADSRQGSEITCRHCLYTHRKQKVYFCCLCKSELAGRSEHWTALMHTAIHRPCSFYLVIPSHMVLLLSAEINLSHHYHTTFTFQLWEMGKNKQKASSFLKSVRPEGYTHFMLLSCWPELNHMGTLSVPGLFYLAVSLRFVLAVVSDRNEFLLFQG